MSLEQIETRYNERWTTYCKKTINKTIDFNESSNVYEFIKRLYLCMNKMYHDDSNKFHLIIDFLENKRNFTQINKDRLIQFYREIMNNPKFSFKQCKQLFKEFCNLPRKKVIQDLVKCIDMGTNDVSLTKIENEKVKDTTTKQNNEEMLKLKISHEIEMRRVKDENAILRKHVQMLEKSNNDKELIIKLLQQTSTTTQLNTHALQ